MKWLSILTLIIFSFSAFAQYPKPYTPVGHITEENFEDPNYFSTTDPHPHKIHDIENCNNSSVSPDNTTTDYGWTLTRVTAAAGYPVFAGNKAVKFEIRKTQPVVGSSQRIRSEVTLIHGTLDSWWPGPDMWYSYCLYVPSTGFDRDSLAWDTITQWSEDGGNDCTVKVTNDKIYYEQIDTATTSMWKYDLFGKPNSARTSSISAAGKNFTPTPRNEWHNFVFHIYHTQNNDSGLVEIWRDGIKLFTIHGRNMHTSIYPKFKIGIYKSNWTTDPTLSTTTQRILFFDNVNVDTTSLVPKTFYFSTTGSTTNSCLSPNFPCPEANFAPLYKESDTFLFKRGDWFYLTMPTLTTTSATKYITVDAYGTGTRPVLSAFTVVNSSANWIQTATANVWSLTIGAPNISGLIPDNAGKGNVGFLKIDGTIYGGKKTQLTDLLQQWDYYSDNASTLYVYSVGKPSLKSNSFLFTTRSNQGFIISASSYMNISNVECLGTGAIGINCNGVVNVDVENCYIHECGGCYETSTGTTRYGVCLQITNGGTNITVNNCKMEQSYEAGFTMQSNVSPTPFSFTNCFFTNDTTYNNECDFNATINTGDSSTNGFVNAKVSGCVFQNAGYSWSHNYRPADNQAVTFISERWNTYQSDLTVENNKIINPREGLYIINGIVPEPRFVSRNNIICIDSSFYLVKPCQVCAQKYKYKLYANGGHQQFTADLGYEVGSTWYFIDSCQLTPATIEVGQDPNDFWWQPSATAPPSTAPSHIVILLLENHAYSQIVGNTTAAPYLNSLLSDPNTTSFSQSFGITHPSQPNYLDFYSGTNQGVTDDNVPAGTTTGSCSTIGTGAFTTNNLGAQLIAAGYSIKIYSEDLPCVGYNANTNLNYARKHNPVANWQGSGTNQYPSTTNQPFSAYPSSNLSSLPTVSIVVPNQNNDMHNGSDPARITAGDTWVQNNMASTIAWVKANNSLLIITFDEDDSQHGNNIPTFLIGAKTVNGTFASPTINHYSILRFIEDLYGLPYVTTNAQNATSIRSFWH